MPLFESRVTDVLLLLFSGESSVLSPCCVMGVGEREEKPESESAAILRGGELSCLVAQRGCREKFLFQQFFTLTVVGA